MNTKAQEIFDQLQYKYKLVTDAQVSYLEIFCTALVNMRSGQAKIDDEGVTVKDRYGVPKSNPANAVVRDSISQAMAALKMLGLDEVSEPNDVLKELE